MTSGRQRQTPEAAALNAALAAYLRGVIGSRQIQQKAIADRFGWAQNFLSKRFSGAVPWGVDELDSVCRYLDLDIRAVMETARQAAQEGDEPQRNAS
ncbi:MAG TPA: hypothetical protein VGL39_27800 [Jatrophihabitantaceae bacterium]|jgi:hypothetical protein